MTNRDEYVQKLKAQIDQWNAQAARWGEQGRQAQAGMQAEYQRQVDNFRARSSEAMAESARLQGASAEAFAEMMRGTESAMKDMQEAFERARKSFEKE